MSDRNKVRLAHELLNEINAREDLTPEQVRLLRSFLPELPKQLTLEEIAHDVYDAWGAAYGNDWADDVFGELEDWLKELHEQLKGLAPAKPAHPEFLKTAEDYRLAPRDTIVAIAGSHPWIKMNNGMWKTTDFDGMTINLNMSICSRRVLRWGMGDV